MSELEPGQGRIAALHSLTRAEAGHAAKVELVAIWLARRAGGDPFAMEVQSCGLNPAPRWVSFKGEAHLAVLAVAEVEWTLALGRHI